MGKIDVKYQEYPRHHHHHDPNFTPPFSIPPHKTEGESMQFQKSPSSPNPNKPRLFDRQREKRVASLPNKIHARTIYPSLSPPTHTLSLSSLFSFPFLFPSRPFDSTTTSRVSEIRFEGLHFVGFLPKI